jgi:hypothetical protein
VKPNQHEEQDYKAGTCFLKTKTDRFKEHWAVLQGNEIYFFRTAADTDYRVMHCLANTFVKDNPAEMCPETRRKFWPVKIVLPPSKSRILYLNSFE